MFSPYLLLFISAGLGWFFNHHRVVYAVALLLVCYGAITHLNLIGELSQHQRFIINGLAVLLPFNFLAVGLMQERRAFFTVRTVTFFIILAFQVTSVYWLYSLYPDKLYTLLMFPINTGAKLAPWLNLPLPVLISYAFASVVIVIRLMKRYSVLDAGLLWTLLITLLAFNTEGSHPHFALFITLATFVLTVTLLQTWYDFAYLDQLTTLPGRLALNEVMKSVKGDYVIAMVDVDFFKKCNDAYGHDVGDQILKMVASKLCQVTGGGSAFRFGGEEFLIFFPNKRIKDAFPHLSALREAIEESHMILRSKARPNAKPNPVPQRRQPLRYINVTVSIGLAEHNDELATSAQVVKAADEALYRAKSRGRNRLSL